MKTTYVYLALIIVLGLSCSDDSPQMADVVYTGNETSYPLASASEFNTGGAAVFKERIDGSTDVLITLDKTFDKIDGLPMCKTCNSLRTSRSFSIESSLRVPAKLCRYLATYLPQIKDFLLQVYADCSGYLTPEWVVCKG